MNKALKLARENGYKLPDPCDYEGIKLYHKAETFTDPLFWQALGKALAWNDYDEVDDNFVVNGVGMTHRLNQTPIPLWQYHAHRWLDAHFEGKEDQFWKDLLQTKS